MTDAERAELYNSGSGLTYPFGALKVFEYTHNDGRIGRGPTTWAAIVAAIGREESPTFAPDHNHWEATPNDETYSRQSPICFNGEQVGMAREVRL